MIRGMKAAAALFGGILLAGSHRGVGLGGGRANAIGGFARLMVSMRAKGGGGGSGSGSGIGERGMTPLYLPKTENQKRFVSALDSVDNKLVVVLGPAGTGKTLFACLKAIRDLKAGVVNRIVITRPVVTVEEDIGFLPGSMRNKMDPWMRPIFDMFLEFYSQRDIDAMVQSGVIEISPLAFMRGRTFKRCFILADEMQNSSPNQMLMLMTRIGDGSRMVVGGDLNQSDRDAVVGGRSGDGASNGLAEFVLRYRRFCLNGGDTSGISVCEMSSGDVERSPVVAKLLDIFSGDSREPLGVKSEAEVIDIKDDDSAIIPKKDFYSRNKPLW